MRASARKSAAGAGKCGADSHALCLPQRRKPSFRAGQSGKAFPCLLWCAETRPKAADSAGGGRFLPAPKKSHTGAHSVLNEPHGITTSGSSVNLPPEDLYSRLLARFSGEGGSSRIK